MHRACGSAFRGERNYNFLPPVIMKKIFALSLAIILSLALFLFPLEQAKAESVAVRFVSAKDIVVFGERFYVLDDIGNGTTVIHSLDLEGSEIKSYILEGSFFNFYLLTVENEEDKNETRVFLLNESGIFYADLQEESGLTLIKCIDADGQYSINQKGLAVYGYGGSFFAFYIASAEGNDYLYRVNLSLALDYSILEITSGKANQLVMQDKSVYVATTSKIVKYEINSVNALSPAQTHKNAGAEIIVAEAWQRVNNVEKDVKSVDESGVNIACLKIASYFKAGEEEKLFYFALCNDNKIYKYFTNSATQHQNRKYTKVETFLLGTDTIIASAPQEQDITGWEIVSCGGYPSDYIYMFKSDGSGQLEEKSVTQGINLAGGEILVRIKTSLPTDRYDYVYYKGKYGFVEKGALQDITNDYKYFATGKVVSNDFVYSLPHADSTNFSVERNTQLKITKFLQLWGEKWYFVSFEVGGKTQSGWIRQSGVTAIVAENNQSAVGIYKVNPPIGKTVAVYKDGGKSAFVIDGAEITLGLGERVTLLQKGDDYCKIQFSRGGTQYIGYIQTQYLLEGGLTTTALLGIALLAVVAAATLFLIIMAKRKKAHSKTHNATRESK